MVADAMILVGGILSSLHDNSIMLKVLFKWENFKGDLS